MPDILKRADFTYQGAPDRLTFLVSVGVMIERPASVGWRVVEAQELLRRVIDGDERAWNEVVDRFAGLVWSVARSYRLSAAATDDVVQTVWLRLAEHASRIRQPERLASWLATTTRNEALRVIRGNNRLTPQPAVDDYADPTTPSVEERVSDDVTLRAVLRAFAELSPEDQQLMRLLCAVPPLDYQTIAELLGRPIGSIGPTRARCLERLKKLLPPGFESKVGLS